MGSRGESVSIRVITENKRDFMPLLLLGDENESYIAAYLKRGDLFALYDGDLKSVCVVTDEGGGVFEIQNIATDKRYQRQGYASQLIDYIATYYAGKCRKIILGTGDVLAVLAFYERCGFKITHYLPDYFTTHYDHPIVEDGVLLKDKIYLERKTAKRHEFDAVIKAEPDSGGAYIVIPFDIKAEYGKGRLKVHAVFDGTTHYDGSIVNMGVKNPDGSVCYIIGITKDIRSKIGKNIGDNVRVTIKERSDYLCQKQQITKQK